MAATPEIDGYSDITRVARGGFGVVYRARQDRHGRTVALKVLDVEDFDERARQRFERECVAMGSLSWHPNVVALLDSGITEDEHPFLAMEYLDDGSFADRLHDGPMPWLEAVVVGIQVAGALDAAHAAGTLHRDLKPENILVGPYGEAKLGDFGIAAVANSGATTAHASFTVGHVAPEVLRGSRPDERADVYGLGSTLHTLISGAPPYQGEPGEPIARQMMRVLEAPTPRIEGIPEDLADLVHRCLAKDPGDRPASAAELGQALQAVQAAAGEPVTELRVARAQGPSPAAEVPPVRVTRGGPTPDSSPTVAGAVTPAAAVPVPPRPPAAPGGGAVPDRTGGRGRRTRVAVAAIALVLVAVVAGGVLLTRSGGGGGGGGDEAADRSASTTVAGPQVTATIEVGARPNGVAVTSGAVWVTSRDDSTLSRIDPATNEVVATIDVGRRPNGVAATEDAVWVADAGSGTVTRVDPATNEVVATIPVGGQPLAVAAVDSQVWVVHGSVTRIDPTRNEAVQSISTEATPASVAIGAGMVWVTDFDGNTISRIDPVTNRDEAILPVGTTPFVVTATSTDVWVTNNDDGTVSRIDAATEETIAAIEVGNSPAGISIDDRGVWVTAVGDDALVLIDPNTDAVVSSIEVGDIPVAVAAEGNEAWVANNGDGTVSRVTLSDD